MDPKWVMTKQDLQERVAMKNTERAGASNPTNTAENRPQTEYQLKMR